MAASPQQRFQQLSGAFEAALNLPPGPERDEYLSQIAKNDLTLYEELRRLLHSDGNIQNSASSAPARLPRFGSYQARELLGVGGMGAVYRATREDGEIHHQVAVKAVASVFWSPLLDERFRRERQILAELQHPNIARFLDGGVGGDGSPYLVMDYVEGERIDAWCDHRALPVRGRLELFLKVCAAVSYAHQKLIVHRDLKPGNILVTSEGEPRLLDFGIARTLEPAAAGVQSTLTPGLFATPSYASPELLRGQHAGVGCDVYSLGVLLYELLTGARPFSGPDTTPAEAIELVLSTEAPPASSSVPDNHEIATTHGAGSAQALRRELRGDLDSVLAKSLAKSPEERYASVEQFAEDLRRHLSGHPVEAASVSTFQRLRKFVVRNKGRAGAAAVILLALIAGLLGTTWEARLARDERAAAERRFNEARQLAHYLVFDLQTSVAGLPGSTPVRAGMVSQSLAYLDKLAAEKTSDEGLRMEVARGYLQLADVLGNPFRPNIGEPTRAKESYRKAIAILSPIAARSPDNREARLFLARGKLMLGRALGFGSGSAEGRELIKHAAEESRRLAARWPSDFAVRSQAAVAFASLAQSLSLQGGYVSTSNPGPALASGHESVAQARAALGINPGDLRTVSQLSGSYKILGDLTELRDRPAATVFFRQSLAALDQLSSADSQTPTARSARSSSLLGLGWNLGNLGHYPEALAALDEARRLRDRASEEDPKNVQALYFRTTPLRDLAVVHQLAGHTAASLDNFLAVIAVYDSLLTRSPANHAFRFSRADLQSEAANLAVKLGRQEEGRRLAFAGLQVLKKAAADPGAGPVEMAIAARALLESEVLSLRGPKLAMAFAKKASGISGKDSEIQEILGEAYWYNGDRARAIEALEAALSLMEQKPTPTRHALEKTLVKYRSAKPGT